MGVQKAKTGTVNWEQAGHDALIGGVAGAVGGDAALAAKALSAWAQVGRVAAAFGASRVGSAYCGPVHVWDLL